MITLSQTKFQHFRVSEGTALVKYLYI